MTLFLEYFCGEEKQRLTVHANVEMYLFSLSKDHESHNLLILLALNAGWVYSQTYSSIFRKKNTTTGEAERGLK